LLGVPHKLEYPKGRKGRQYNADLYLVVEPRVGPAFTYISTPPGVAFRAAGGLSIERGYRPG
jgi:hypothetical protein